MKKSSFLRAVVFVVAALLFVGNQAMAQNKLVVLSPSVVYDNALAGIANVDMFNIPVDQNALESILTKLQTKEYAELHIYALTEADMIGFHGLQLWLAGLDNSKTVLNKFQKFSIKIVVHSKVLGKTENGQALLSELSKLMGNTVEVQN